MWLLVILVYGAFGSPTFEQEPIAITAVIGESVSLQCLVDGPVTEDANLVQWVKGNLALGFPPLTNSRYTQSIGPRNYSLQIDDVQLSDEDEFECQITPVGLRSKTAKLEALAPPKTVDISPVGGEIKIIKQPSKEIYQVVEGTPSRLRCIATDSKPKTTLQWSIADAGLNATSSVSGDILLTTFSEVILLPRKEDHGSQLTCYASNQALKTPIAVSVVLDVQTLPDVSVQIPDDNLAEGSSLLAECVVVANPPVHAYYWKYNGNILDSKNSSKIQMENIEWTMHGKSISCTAVNAVGESTASATIKVEYAPVLTSATNQRVVANSSGEYVELECAFAGNPTPVVTWTRGTETDEIISDKPMLRFASVQQSDGDRYNCVATSELGRAAGTVDLAVRGPPLITSEKEQFGGLLECAFTSEPLAQIVKVIDLSRDDGDAVIHESYSNNHTVVTIEIEVGQYECQVTNELGMASTVIRIQPEGLAVGPKVGIVVGILIIVALLVFIACLKLKFFPREHRLKLKPENDREEFICGDSRSEKHFVPTFDHPIEIIHSSGTFSGATKIDRASHDELYSTGIEELNHEQPTNRGLGGIGLAGNNLNSESGSTGRSAQDDGYGTESGSNQKVNTVSTDSSHSESNSDYEVHVSSLTSSAAVPSSERSSKICVIWDDATVHTYQPQQIRNQTQLIQTRINRTRSVSHV